MGVHNSHKLAWVQYMRGIKPEAKRHAPNRFEQLHSYSRMGGKFPTEENVANVRQSMSFISSCPASQGLLIKYYEASGERSERQSAAVNRKSPQTYIAIEISSNMLDVVRFIYKCTGFSLMSNPSTLQDAPPISHRWGFISF